MRERGCSGSSTGASIIVFTTTMMLVSCGGDHNDNAPAPADQLSHSVSGLTPGTTYYWKVVADDGKGGATESAVWSFSTQ